MQRNAFGSVPAAVMLALAACGTVWGQPVPSRAPDSTHIYPAGGGRGQVVAVRVGAECLPPGAEFFVLGEGVSAPERLERQLASAGEPSPRRVPTEIPISYPKEWESQIQIDADAPLGVVYWRLSCAQGGTSCRPFFVGDLAEHLESEWNSAPEAAERVTLPVTLNGQINGERDMDYYLFSLDQGETATCEVYARRLDSRLDPLVEVTDGGGRRLPIAKHYVGGDLVLAFQAPQSGEYLLRVADVGVHGSPAHVYRIHLTSRPYAESVWPAGGRAGESAEVELLALGSGQRIRRTVQLPATPGPFLYQDVTLAAPLMLSADANVSRVEQEPNDADRCEKIQPGTTVYGRLETAMDEDWFRFHARGDQRLEIVCHAFPQGSAALPVIQLATADGQALQTARSVEAADGICRLDWTPPADGEYLLRIRDLRFAAQGGQLFLYRLSVSAAPPDFALTIDTDVADVQQGEQVEVEVKARRSGGFTSQIRLQVDGLPSHVQVESARIEEGQPSGKLVFKTGGEVVAQSSRLQIVGTAEIDGQTVTRTALAKHRGCAGQFPGADARTPQFFLTVRHKPVFRLQCSEAYLYAHRGSIFPYPMEIERLDGFDGEIQLQIGDRQNRDLDGIQMLPITVPSGQTTFHMPIYLPETMHINVQSQSQLYTQAFARFTDKHGRQQSVLVVSEKRNMLRTRPPVVKLTAADPIVDAVAGQPAEVPLRLKRTSNFRGPMQVSLWESDRNGFSVETLVIPAGSDGGAIRVTPPTNLLPGDEVQLVFRGRGDLYDGVTIISEAAVTLRGADR